MSRPRSRAVRLGVVCLAQLALVGVAVAGPLSARVSGEEYVLEVAPVDPVDPFRGAYVALAYPSLADEANRSNGELAAGERGEIFVPLVRVGELWRGGTPTRARPVEGPYLRCDDADWRLRCGIESYFLPQGTALELERAVAEGRALARVKVDARGNAALMRVEATRR